MKRWFGVLVLGGAALAACTEGDDAQEEAGEGAKGPSGTGGSGQGGEAVGATTASGGSGAQGAQGGDSPGAGGSIECPATADPNAACGCPCCWVSDCLNDEPCCEAFCGLGNDGAGCCGV